MSCYFVCNKKTERMITKKNIFKNIIIEIKTLFSLSIHNYKL
jgi:hypothetical protein